MTLKLKKSNWQQQSFHLPYWKPGLPVASSNLEQEMKLINRIEKFAKKDRPARSKNAKKTNVICRSSKTRNRWEFCGQDFYFCLNYDQEGQSQTSINSRFALLFLRCTGRNIRFGNHLGGSALFYVQNICGDSIMHLVVWEWSDFRIIWFVDSFWSGFNEMFVATN